MKWKSEYATGIERIDTQHKRLFQMSEDFRSALDEGGGERTYGGFLDFLEAYCEGHFRYEERCMDEYRCPVAEKNKEEHAKLLAALGDYQVRYAASGFLHEDASTLIDTVDRWLDQHICQVDVHLRNCVPN